VNRIAAALVLTRSVGSSTREIGVFRYLYSGRARHAIPTEDANRPTW
jgi:hypothetical protein